MGCTSKGCCRTSYRGQCNGAQRQTATLGPRSHILGPLLFLLSVGRNESLQIIRNRPPLFGRPLFRLCPNATSRRRGQSRNNPPGRVRGPRPLCPPNPARKSGATRGWRFYLIAPATRMTVIGRAIFFDAHLVLE